MVSGMIVKAFHRAVTVGDKLKTQICGKIGNFSIGDHKS